MRTGHTKLLFSWDDYPVDAMWRALVDAVAPMDIRPGIERLLERKRVTAELGTGKPVPGLGRFIEEELGRHRDEFSGRGRPDLLDSKELRARLNRIFREAVGGTAAAGR